MAKKIEEDKLIHLKVISRLCDQRDAIIQNLDAGTVHGNTQIKNIDVLTVLLAAYYNPTCRSLRLIEQLSELDWAKDRFGVKKVCKSTLSDALARFNPDKLLPMIKHLSDQIPRLKRINGDLHKLTKQVLIADGSRFDLASDVTWALKSNQSGKYNCRVDLLFDLESYMPYGLQVCGNDQGSEPEAFIGMLEAEKVYITDRNFTHFGFINAVLDLGSDLVLFLKKKVNFEIHQEWPLSAKDIEAGVISDRTGILPGSGSGKVDNRAKADNAQAANATDANATDVKAGKPKTKTKAKGKRGGKGRTTAPPTRTLREIRIVCPETNREIRILTSLMDLEAHVLANLYRLRWQIELFLRWLKMWAGMDHLISHSQNGITVQLYVAMIACLMMHIADGRKVDKYSVFMYGHYVCGRATMEEVRTALAKRDREKLLAKLCYQKRKALKTTALLPG